VVLYSVTPLPLYPYFHCSNNFTGGRVI